MSGLLRLEEYCGSIPGSNRPAELVIHPDPQHVVSDPRVIAAVEEAAAKGSGRCRPWWLCRRRTAPRPATLKDCRQTLRISLGRAYSSRLCKFLRGLGLHRV